MGRAVDEKNYVYMGCGFNVVLVWWKRFGQ